MNSGAKTASIRMPVRCLNRDQPEICGSGKLGCMATQEQAKMVAIQLHTISCVVRRSGVSALLEDSRRRGSEVEVRGALEEGLKIANKINVVIMVSVCRWVELAYLTLTSAQVLIEERGCVKCP